MSPKFSTTHKTHDLTLGPAPCVDKPIRVLPLEDSHIQFNSDSRK